MLEAAKRRSGSGEPVHTSHVEDRNGVGRYQAAVAELGQMALEDSSVESLFRIVSTRVAQLMSADFVAIMEVEDDRRLRLKAGVGWSPECIGAVVAEWDEGGFLAYPPILREPIVDGFLGALLHPDAAFPKDLADEISTVQTVPVGKSDAPIGALGVFSRAKREFFPHELTFLRSIAQTIASAVERSRIEERVRREAEERAMVGEIGRIIGSSLDIEEVYSLFAHQVRRLIKFDRITINVVNLENDTYTSAYVAGMPVDGWEKGVDQPMAGKGVEAVTRMRAGVIVQGENTAEFLRRYPRTVIGPKCGLLSMMNVPVMWKGEVIGVLALRSKEENAYSVRDLQLTERITAQIAGALANSALHAEQKVYAQEQATLAEISRIIASSVRINEIYPRFAEAVRKLIPFDRISINTADEENGTVMARYMWGKDFPGSGLFVTRSMKGTATGAVIEARASLIISEESILEGADRFAFLQAGLEAGLRSTLAAPLMYRGRVIGSLMFRSFERNAYSLRELALAERVAVQISGAIWSAHLNERLEQSAREQAMLAELGRGTIQARDMTNVFEQLHNILTRCIEFDRIVVGLHDSDHSSLRYEYVRGVQVEGMDEGSILQRPAAIASTVAWADFMSAHCGSSHREGLDGPDEVRVIRDAGLKSWLQAPLKSRNRLIGLISLRSRRESAFSISDLRLLERVAVQVAPAVDNVNFYHRAQQDAMHRVALEDMIRAFGQPRNRHELLSNSVEQIRDSIPADSVTITSTAPALDHLAVEFNHSSHGDDALREELEILNERIAAAVVESRSSLIVDSGMEFGDSGERGPDFAEDLMRIGFQSSLSVPLLSGGAVIAVLHFHSIGLHVYSQRYRLLAEQAGMLLTNALGPLQAPSPKTMETQPGENKVQSPLAILVADSQRMCRQAIRAAVSPTGVSVAAESNEASNFVALARSSGARVLIWEIHEEEEADLSAISSLIETYPDAGVVIIDNGCGSGLLNEAMRSGARGFLLKDTPNDQLADALRKVANGETVVDPRALKSYFEKFPSHQGSVSRDVSATMERLGDRDVAILQAVANGNSNAEIAESLSFAVGTIKNRLAKIYRELGVSDRAGAMAFAIRAGLVS